VNDAPALNGCTIRTPTAAAAKELNCVMQSAPVKRSASCGAVTMDQPSTSYQPSTAIATGGSASDLRY